MADVLNEAADAEDRNIEGNRRQALTLQQIKSDQQKNQLASEQGERDKTRFGYETERLDQEQKDRQNLNSYRDANVKIGQKHFFESVENPAWTDANKNAVAMANANGQPAPTIDPSIPQYLIKPIDLASRKGLAATAAYTNESFINGLNHNLITRDDIEKTLATREKLEKQGYLADARLALKGDPDALKNLTAAMGLPPGSTSLTTELDKNGVPKLFVSSIDAKGNSQKKDVSNLIAAVSPEFYDAVMVKPTATAAAVSNIEYQGVAGAAATKNANNSAVTADAAKQNAATNATNSKNLGELYKARAAALDDRGAPVNTAAYRSQFFSSQLDTEGKNLMLPSGSSNQGRIKGVAQELGLTTGQSDSFAQTEWANLMGLRDQAVAREKLVVDPTGKKTFWSKQELVQMEDRALSKLTDALVKDKSEQGPLFQRASAYAKRRAEKRASAMKSEKDEE